MSTPMTGDTTPQQQAVDLIHVFIAQEVGDADLLGVMRDQAERLTAKLAEAGLLVDKDVLDVLTYVSSGRGYVGVTPYPDFQARRALGRIRDV